MDVAARLESQVADFNFAFPAIYRDITAIRAYKHEWPEWCYVPSGVIKQIFEHTEKEAWQEFLDDTGRGAALSLAGALASWRATKSIFEFEAELAESLIGTRLNGALPIDIFKRLPNWCVYVNHRIFIGNSFADGFFVHLDAGKHGFGVITVTFDTTSALANSKEANKRQIKPSDALGIQLRLKLNGKSIVEQLAEQIESVAPGLKDTEDAHFIVDKFGGALRSALSLALYLCSEEPDVLNLKHPSERPANPQPIKTRNGLKEFAAATATTWTVGSRVGAALKKAKQEIERQQSAGSEHSSPRPHIRAAHWHTFWTGKGRTEPRIKWLAPILVKTDIAEALPIVTRKVAA